APGQRVRCPKCKTGFPIPDEEEEAAVAQRPRRGEERDQTPRPTRRSRRDDDDDDDRPRRPRKKKKASKAALVIGLSFVGVLVIAGVFVILIAVSQGWFSSSDSGGSSTSSDRSKPGDKAGGPDRPDKGGGPIVPPPATGQGKVIPRNIMDQSSPMGAFPKEAEALSKLEQLLGAPGKRLNAAELAEASQDASVQAVRGNAPNAYCYRWTSPTHALYVFFDGGEWRGSAFAQKKIR